MRQDLFPPAIFVLIMSCALVFIAYPTPMFNGFLQHWALVTYLPEFRPWQLVSYAFLHDPRNLTHIAFNMFALWMFGRSLEYRWGTPRFVLYYFVCVVGAALTQLAVTLVSGVPSIVVGASGGVYGVLLAFGMTFPEQRIMLLFPPIPMKAKYMVLLFGALEIYLGLATSNSGVAHFAHIGGMAFGFALLHYWRQKPARPRW